MIDARYFCQKIRVVVRLLYSFLFYLATPLLVLRLLWRSVRLPAYRQRISERFGLYPFKLNQCIWIHAVSVGEMLASVPLIEHLKITYPKIPILVTTMTPTGAERVKKIFASSILHAYLPYDLPEAIRRFLHNMNPIIAIIMETELWPNLIHNCANRAIPICLINARLSARSAQKYQKIISLTRQMLSSISVIAVNSKADADRFYTLGAEAEKIVITGNIKYDLMVPQDLSSKTIELERQFAKRYIWVAASTHEGEEEIVLKAHKLLLQIDPHALLILAPRHPDRFKRVSLLCEQNGFVLQKRNRSSKHELIHCEVYLVDTMGELLLFYNIAHVAFIGGSLIAHGGHNLVEPAVLAKPIITGKHLFNFSEISEHFLNAQALNLVNNEKDLAQLLIKFYQDRNFILEQGARAKTVVEQNRGALQKQLKLINYFLTKYA